MTLQTSPPKNEVLCVSFNQDATGLCVGMRRGYQLYAITANEDIVMTYENTDVRDVYIIERLYVSSLIVYSTLDCPRKLQIWHFQKQQEICCQSYTNSILTVRLNRIRLVVCLESSLYIHNIK